jgi:hypothetical protein
MLGQRKKAGEASGMLTTQAGATAATNEAGADVSIDTVLNPAIVA